MRGGMEKLLDIFQEQTRETTSTFMCGLKNLQLEIQSSVQRKEQILAGIDGLKKSICQLQSADKKREDELAQLSKTLHDEIKLLPETVIGKLEELYKATKQVHHNVDAFKTNLETHQQQLINFTTETPLTVKSLEERVIAGLEKIEFQMTSLRMRETLETSLENWFGEMQLLLKNTSDSNLRKIRAELKDTVSKEQKRALETSLKKYLKVLSEQLDEKSRKFNDNHQIQKATLQSMTEYGYEQIRAPLEQCQAYFEKESKLLHQIDQRLRQCSENFFAQSFHKLEQLQPFSSTNRNSDPVPSKMDQSVTETDSIVRCQPRNVDQGQIETRPRFTEANLNTFLKSPQQPSTVNTSYQVCQNISFSTHDGFSPMVKENNMAFPPQSVSQVLEKGSSLMWHLQNNGNISTSQPYNSKGLNKLKPSPVANVKPQRRNNQSKYSHLVRGKFVLSPTNDFAKGDHKYDLRKRRMSDYTSNHIPSVDKKSRSYQFIHSKPQETGVPYSHTRKDELKRYVMENMSNNNDSASFHSPFLKSSQHLVSTSKPKQIMESEKRQKSVYEFEDDSMGVNDLRKGLGLKEIKENYKKRDSSLKASSEISSPAHSILSLTRALPLRNASSSFNRKQGSADISSSMFPRSRLSEGSPHPTLLSDL